MGLPWVCLGKFPVLENISESGGKLAKNGVLVTKPRVRRTATTKRGWSRFDHMTGTWCRNEAAAHFWLIPFLTRDPEVWVQPQFTLPRFDHVRMCPRNLRLQPLFYKAHRIHLIRKIEIAGTNWGCLAILNRPQLWWRFSPNQNYSLTDSYEEILHKAYGILFFQQTPKVTEIESRGRQK